MNMNTKTTSSMDDTIAGELATTGKRFTRTERSWILYDVGNSAFVLLITSILPIYFNNLAKQAGLAPSTYLAYWSYGTSVCTAIVALMGPILGSIADQSGGKKRIFLSSVIFGLLCMLGMIIPTGWLSFLIVFMLAKIGFQASLIFYDAMLTDITVSDRMDRVSTSGYAFGYIGSCVPFVLSLGVVLGTDLLGISAKQGINLAIIINAIWWAAFTIPLLRRYKQIHYVERTGDGAAEVFRRLGHTLKELVRHKAAFYFLIAFVLYIDGVYTIIDLAASYGESIGIEAQELLIALLLTQVIAFPATLVFGKLSKRFKNTTLIQVSIVGYALIALFAIQLDRAWEFYFLALCVGLFQGGIQALSRSYFGQIIPPERSGEYFSLYDICGKGASIIGTAIVGVISQVTGRQNVAISTLVVLFVAGLIVLRMAIRQGGAAGRSFQ
ncbi:MAG: MFS transporter [Fastidiosipilaceae bacterium]|jgi:UMF1 family MFS transporter